MQFWGGCQESSNSLLGVVSGQSLSWGSCQHIVWGYNYLEARLGWRVRSTWPWAGHFSPHHVEPSMGSLISFMSFYLASPLESFPKDSKTEITISFRPRLRSQTPIFLQNHIGSLGHSYSIGEENASGCEYKKERILDWHFWCYCYSLSLPSSTLQL